MLKKVDHIAFAVKDIKAISSIYSKMNFKPSDIEEIVEEGIKRAFINLDNIKIEFISPLTLDHNLWKFFEKKQEGFHHICFIVKELDQVIKRFQDLGYNFTYKEPLKLKTGERIIFIHPKESGGILIELKENNQNIKMIS